MIHWIWLPVPACVSLVAGYIFRSLMERAADEHREPREGANP